MLLKISFLTFMICRLDIMLGLQWFIFIFRDFHPLFFSILFKIQYTVINCFTANAVYELCNVRVYDLEQMLRNYMLDYGTT